MIDFDKMPQTVAIIGSRSFYKNRKEIPLGHKRVKSAVTRFVERLGNTREVVSGGALGIDRYAEDAAKKYGNTFTPFRPEGDLSQSETYLRRNRELVSYVSQKNGMIVAFVDDNDCRGTMYTIRHARLMGCDNMVFHFKADGTYEGYEGE